MENWIPSSRICAFVVAFRVLAFSVVLAAQIGAADRMAFVVGVDHYDSLPESAQLNVAVSDAKGMAETLGKLDPPFQVTLHTDSTRAETWDSLLHWVSEAREAECALVYFAGHGVEFHGENFLLMRDTRVENISEGVDRMKRRLGNVAISLQSLVDELDGTSATVKVVILDACRDNPLTAEDSAGTRSLLGSRGGLAQVTPPGGTVISYSADAGQQANDGLFTSILRKHLIVPGVPLPQVFAATREEVVRESAALAAAMRGVRHEPAEYTKLTVAGNQFTFTRASAAGGADEIERRARDMAEKMLAEKAAKGKGSRTAGEADLAILKTNFGDITIQLNPEKAPESVKNFRAYIEEGFYDNTVFHRIIGGFMIQGGGFELKKDGVIEEKPTREPISNEAENGLRNERGTISMARNSNPHSATAQFFINHADNFNLDHPSMDGWGYAVFGQVVEGLDVVDKIAALATTSKTLVTLGEGAKYETEMENVPNENVIIESIELITK